MAYYAALVPLVQLLNDITHHERYPNFLLHKQQIATLNEKFNLLQKSLDDFSPKNHQEESVDVLQRRIRNAAYKVQDIIESHLSTTFSTQIHRKNKILGFKNLVSASVPLHNTLGKEYQELERVKEEIDSILDEIMRIKESHSAHGRNTMVGFEEQQTKIKDQLCGESSKREVISIVGIGGIGKTTLAANIFDDKLVYDRFDCRAWVSISQYYHIPKVLQDIADSMNTNTGLSGACEGVLADHIYKYLVGRRYLIIIDDIWDIKVWDGIKWIFPDNSNASRIMITTRMYDVANYIGRCAFVHQMQFLNEDQSWNLLQQKVFAQEHCPEELEVIGKLIAKNCRGLPLAIVGIAGVLLNVNKARNDWVEIARNVSSAAIHKNDEHVSKILSLSYNHLPHHLKSCFLYLGGFIGNKTIEVSKVIRLWVAEGFLKPTESKSMEEVGEEYFKDLVNRNLVLVTKKTSNGKYRYCSIHDVMRDLCSQIAHCENLLLCVQEQHDFHPKPIGNARRLFFPTPAAYFSFRKYITEHASHVRSVIINANYQDDDQCLSVASGCKLLRILDGTTISHPSIPNAIFELLHIRYLALKVSGDIHPFIFRLSNLQTLILNGVISLPPAIWKMPTKACYYSGSKFVPISLCL